MSRRIFLTTLILVLSVTVTVLTLQRQDDDMFIKVAIWNATSPEHMSVPFVRYFVIENDGTFASYLGTSRSHNDITRRNFMRTIQEKEIMDLDEQDFQSISELVSKVIAIENDFSQWTETVMSDMMFVTLYHDGNIYGNSTVRSGYFHELTEKLIQLSPLSIR